jgi:hypothetical protein
LRVGGTLELNLGWSAHAAVVLLVKDAGGGGEGGGRGVGRREGGREDLGLEEKRWRRI